MTGWITPDGKTYECQPNGHKAAAATIWLNKGKNPTDPETAAELAGWIKVVKNFPIPQRHPTPQQWDTLQNLELA